MSHAWITRDPIGAESVLSLVGGASDGATVLFLGHVRDRNDGQSVSGMRYEAYVDMAERVLADIADTAAAGLGRGAVAVVHRIGDLRVGEVSVAIAVSSPHRRNAFGACREIIEAVKSRLPVWKQERYADGSAEWLAGPSAAGDSA